MKICIHRSLPLSYIWVIIEIKTKFWNDCKKNSYYLGPYFLFLRKFHLHKVIAAMLNNIFNLSSSSTSFIAWTAEIKIDIEVIIWSMRSSGFRWISQKILYLHEYISEIKNVFTYASLCIDWKCMIYWQQITQVSYVCDYLKTI